MIQIVKSNIKESTDGLKNYKMILLQTNKLLNIDAAHNPVNVGRYIKTCRVRNEKFWLKYYELKNIETPGNVFESAKELG